MTLCLMKNWNVKHRLVVAIDNRLASYLDCSCGLFIKGLINSYSHKVGVLLGVLSDKLFLVQRQNSCDDQIWLRR